MLKINLPRILIVGLASLVVFLAYAILAISNDGPAIEFLNVGQGDSALIKLPSKTYSVPPCSADWLRRCLVRDISMAKIASWLTPGNNGVKILIDGGNPGVLLGELNKATNGDRYIDLLIMSHPQLDHFGGFIDVLKNYKIGAFIGTGRQGASGAYKELMARLKKDQVPYVFLGQGDQIIYKDNKLKVIWPEDYALLSDELNSGSLVLLAEINGRKLLLTGDIGSEFDLTLAKAAGDIDILKVAHHGSKYSTSQEFLAITKPETAVISVGKNSYGHPTDEALGRLKNVGAEILRTDLLGTIKLRLD